MKELDISEASNMTGDWERLKARSRGIMFSTNMEFCLTNFAYGYCENDNKITNIKMYQ